MAHNEKIARKLCDITNAFYREQAVSFSATRQAPWPGWHRCLDIVRAEHPEGFDQLSVFDVACGNLRFEKFMASEFPDTALAFYAVDNCDSLVETAPGLGFRDGNSQDAGRRDAGSQDEGGRDAGETGGPTAAAPAHPGLLKIGSGEQHFELTYQNVDIMQALFEHGGLNDKLSARLCNLSVSFGFMHHIPLVSQREKLLATLIDHTSPQGIVAVSFWRFLNSPDLAKRACATHAKACEELGLSGLDEGDYLLGWKNLPGRYRYCHNFSDDEIDAFALSAASRTEVLARFSSDGRIGNLNDYLVLRVL